MITWKKAKTGNTVFQFKTGTKFKDGAPKIIKTFNSKGAEVALGDKKIGNGSRGRIQGSMGIYEVKSKQGATMGAGVTLYLDGIQISKFVQWVGGPQFDAIEGEEDTFEGVGDMGGIPDESGSGAAQQKEPDPSQAKVRL